MGFSNMPLLRWGLGSRTGATPSPLNQCLIAVSGPCGARSAKVTPSQPIKCVPRARPHAPCSALQIPVEKIVDLKKDVIVKQEVPVPCHLYVERAIERPVEKVWDRAPWEGQGGCLRTPEIPTGKCQPLHTHTSDVWRVVRGTSAPLLTICSDLPLWRPPPCQSGKTTLCGACMLRGMRSRVQDTTGTGGWWTRFCGWDSNSIRFYEKEVRENLRALDQV